MPEFDRAVRLSVPIAGTSEIVCIGLEYAGHGTDVDLALPVEPIPFLEPTTALRGALDRPIGPRGSHEQRFGFEFAVAIGTRGRCLPVERARADPAGYCIANENTERSPNEIDRFWNERQVGQGIRGEDGEGFATLGRWSVTPDELTDPRDFAVRPRGRLPPDAGRFDPDEDLAIRTKPLDFASIVSFASHTTILLPTGIVATGTRPDIGHGRNPPFSLRPGRTVRAGIARLD